MEDCRALKQWRDQIRRFLREESGVIHAVSYLLLVTIIVLGMVAGLSSLRNSFVQRMGDISGALESLNQSYTFTVAGVASTFTDGGAVVDPDGSEPFGITVQATATLE